MKERKDDKQNILTSQLSRRNFIKLGLLSTSLCLIPAKVVASADGLITEERTICVYNLHTKEYLQATYWKNGQYVREVLDDCNHLFRDHYTGVVRRVDRHLLDFLFALQKKLNCSEPFHLISGYRTAKTNARLRAGNKKTARKSLHMYGKAADIRIPGVSLKLLRRAAYKMRKGGVGYYPRANFVHVDTGKIRFWNQNS
jgi:uncharacterized protein YcbK (DUF882 family)